MRFDRLSPTLAALIAAVSLVACAEGPTNGDTGFDASDAGTDLEPEVDDAADEGDQRDEFTDTPPACEGLGCPCVTDAACVSGVCAPTDDGGVCVSRCADEDCDAPWGCIRLRDRAGAERAWCLPPRAAACGTCEDGDACSDAMRCTDLVDGPACLPLCLDGRWCELGSACEDRGVGRVCVPEGGACAECVDRDGDRHGLGRECAGWDCDDTDDQVHGGAEELCNGDDDDCDGEVDEDFAFDSDPENCGGCGRSCVLEGAVAAIDCELEEAFERHSHALVLGRVSAITLGGGAALLYGDGRYGTFAGLMP